MKKKRALKIALGISTSAILSLGLPTVASGDSLIPSPAIAVIDTGVDPTNSLIQNRIVHEVCILSFNLCPNGKNFMEGPGTAAVPEIALNKNKDFFHGTQMASIIVKENPDVNLIFIRVVANTSTGAKASTNPIVIGRALQWVAENSEKLNIAAVSTSMGVAQKNGSCVADPGFSDAIDLLNSKGIPAFFPTGNGYNYKSVDFPACDSRTVAVGGLDYIGKTFNPALYSNYSADVDFFVLGKQSVIKRDGGWEPKVGTSVASAALASRYMKLKLTYPDLTSTQIIDSFANNSFTAYSSKKTGSFPVKALDLSSIAK